MVTEVKVIFVQIQFFELVGVTTSAGGIICTFLLLFGLTLTSLDQTKYRNDTAYTYVHNKPVTIWRLRKLKRFRSVNFRIVNYR